MTAIAITAANVVKGADAVTETGLAGATITAGQAVYRDPTSKKFLLADNNDASADIRNARGISLNSVSLNQPMTVQFGGDLTIGGTVAPGVIYCLGATAGGIIPAADLVTGNYTCVLGIGKSTSVIKVGVLNGLTAV